MEESLTQSSLPKLGYHYFPDGLHYRQKDLLTWLPLLKALGASWLSCVSPQYRAIPEYFITPLIQAGIQPVVHFPLRSVQEDPLQDIRLLLHTYAKWGVQYATFFEHPNNQDQWPPSLWVQGELVEKFLDLYIPFATAALAEGILPIFPPLQAGGDYWDLVFLQSCLRSLKKRSDPQVLERFCLGAQATSIYPDPQWGAGGPARWPSSKPYNTPEGSQDQQGFHIFDWYLPVVEAELGRSCPIFLFEAGSRLSVTGNPMVDQEQLNSHTQHNLALLKALLDTSGPTPTPTQCISACNFVLFSSDPGSHLESLAWIRADGAQLPIVESVKSWITGLNPSLPKINPNQITANHTPMLKSSGKIIAHYLLLPLHPWGAAEWDIANVESFLLQYHPTSGYSLQEARFACHVTILASSPENDREIYQQLADSGCQIDWLLADGTVVASL